MENVRNDIKRDDTVQVKSGRDKGKRGKVLRVYPKKNRALVEGINLMTKAMKPNPQLNQSGGFVQRETTIHLSNLQPFCPTCEKGVRVGVRMNPDGEKQRICKKCNGVIA